MIGLHRSAIRDHLGSGLGCGDPADYLYMVGTRKGDG